MTVDDYSIDTLVCQAELYLGSGSVLLIMPCRNKITHDFCTDYLPQLKSGHSPFWLSDIGVTIVIETEIV